MADTSSTDPVFQIQRMYLKEASLEQPNSPEVLSDPTQPGVDISLAVGAQPVVDGFFEVTVAATVQAKLPNDKTLFLVECKQAGIFEIRNVPEDQMGQILGISCPGIVYPYLRANVADLINRAGFPPVHMTEINFLAMYQQQIEASQAPSSPVLANA
jgi:preprotein translocase subunit SecB